MWICILFFCTASVLSAQPSGTDSTSQQKMNDTIKTEMKYYFGISSSIATNQRTVGLPSEYHSQFGNDPVIGIGVGTIIWGDSFLKTEKLRTSMTFMKYLNTYPNPKILENLQMDLQFGYAVIETSHLKMYPMVGFGSSIISLDSLTRIALLNLSGGIGADYLIPNTPLLLTLQASYNHSFNLRSPVDIPNSQSGFNLRAGVSIYLRSRYSVSGWD
jgi:hypothetical protein